jgi:Tfp pilus assembly protein PilO
MVLSKRERIILMVTLVCVGLLVAVEFVYDPVQTKLTDMETQRTQLRGDLEEANLLLENQRRKQGTWKTQMSDGPRSASEVESRVSSALTQWSNRARLSLSSIKPDRGASEKGMQETVFTVAGKGALDAVAQFLWQIETAALPVKIKDMQIGSSSDSGESMSLQLHLSVLYLGAQTQQPEQRTPEANNEEDI